LSILPFYADIFLYLDQSVLDNQKLRQLNQMVWQQDNFGWFSGQILDYILRPNDAYTKLIKKSEKELDFNNKRPIVG
jgi:hypothetical protein